MTCHQIKNGFICLAVVDFDCPTCKKQYIDSDDKYLNRCNKNKDGCTKIKCECGITFNMTYNYKGDAVSFMQTK